MKPSPTVTAYVKIKRFDSDPRLLGGQIKFGAKHPDVTFPHPLHLIVALIILLPAIRTTFGQTTIVAVRDSSQVVLAADSKMSGSGGTPRFCKIKPCGDAFLATSGLVRILDQNIWSSALSKACGGRAQPKERTTMLEKAFLGWINDAITLARSKASQPEYADFLDKKAVVSFVLVGYQNGPYIFARGIGHDGSKAILSPAQFDYDTPITKADVNQVLLGYFDEILRFKKNPPYRTLGLAKGAEFLVNYMILEAPNEVGPPVDVLLVDETGAHWIQRKPECEEAKKEPAKKPTPKPTRRARKRG